MNLMFGIEMKGKIVLDIGGFDGKLAYEALRAGALSAICLDNREWERYGWDSPIRKPGPIYQDGDFLTDGEPADIVFCFNVIYHIPDPWTALSRLRELTREHLVIRSSYICEEETDLQPDGWWKTYPNGSGHSNTTVWTRPSKVGLYNSLGAVGFQNIREIIEPLRPNDEVTFAVSCGD